MAEKSKERKPIVCTVEFTEGAMDRITAAFVDLRHQIKQGIYKGPVFPEEKEEGTA